MPDVAEPDLIGDDQPEVYDLICVGTGLGETMLAACVPPSRLPATQIETVLDETTAELMKCAITADCATKELTAKISQPVRLHSTYRVECEIARHSSVQSWVTAAIFDPRDETVVASCEARMANLSAFTRMRQR